MAGGRGRPADRRARRFLRSGRALLAGHPAAPAHQPAGGSAGGDRGSVSLFYGPQDDRVLPAGRPRGRSGWSKVRLFGTPPLPTPNPLHPTHNSPPHFLALTLPPP